MPGTESGPEGVQYTVAKGEGVLGGCSNRRGVQPFGMGKMNFGSPLRTWGLGEEGWDVGTEELPRRKEAEASAEREGGAGAGPA